MSTCEAKNFIFLVGENVGIACDISTPFCLFKEQFPLAYLDQSGSLLFPLDVRRLRLRPS